MNNMFGIDRHFPLLGRDSDGWAGPWFSFEAWPSAIPLDLTGDLDELVRFGAPQPVWI